MLPPARGTEDLVQYLAEFDLTLADLVPEQMLMFVAARNAAGYVQDLEIPLASPRQTERGSALRERESETRRRAAAYLSDCLSTHVPDDEMQIGLAGSAEDLPRIFPAQWLLDEVCPTAFYAKLVDRELFMPHWQPTLNDSRDGEDEAQQWEYLDELAAAQFTRQHAYVLLDTSRSMSDRDRRGTVARGLTLAFLLHGQDQQAWLHLRPFTARVAELSEGNSKSDFYAITRRVIELPNAGQTRIQAALEQATCDIRSPGPCRRADILLITDGLSRLARNPLVGETLHTFLLGNLPNKDRQSGTVATLKGWSETFHHVCEHDFAELLVPRAGDLRPTAALLERALRQAEDASDQADADQLRRIAGNVRALLDEFDRLSDGTTLDPDLRQALEDQLTRIRQLSSRSRANRSPGDGQGLPDRSAFDRLPRLALSRQFGRFGDQLSLRDLLCQWIGRLAGLFRRLLGRLRGEGLQ